ncbi:bacteriocin [Ignicoccus islandicus DSM 13165]|uniref:Bacteriocin n=1 Tax=Ignicoccus islandicus DSM 13165 TaxID=940295 RepID=A0A0U3F6Q8_9CREN|nr:ferritin family protein [Ignicoccus islandicus]ALU11752.1 bacteriocin [Ignicoccus islandicus DSM 13165]
MLGENPLKIPKDRKFKKVEVAQALRWGVIAELDAINFYEQLAEAIDDERVRKVFLNVAREEKEHVGEFLALLLEYDEELKEMIGKGYKEVEEETGVKPKSLP